MRPGEWPIALYLSPVVWLLWKRYSNRTPYPLQMRSTTGTARERLSSMYKEQMEVQFLLRKNKST